MVSEEELGLLDAATASLYRDLSGSDFGQSMAELDPVSTGEQTTVPSRSVSE